MHCVRDFGGSVEGARIMALSAGTGDGSGTAGQESGCRSRHGRPGVLWTGLVRGEFRGAS